MKDETAGYLAIATVVTCLGAWITHIIHCLVTAKYLLLIAGGFFFPHWHDSWVWYLVRSKLVMGTKGIDQRPYDREKFNNNFDSIFGKKEKKKRGG